MIVLDTTSQKETVPVATTSTHSHTCTGSYRALLVSIFKFAGGDSVTSVTYAGVEMTLLGKVAADGSGYTYLYGLVNPASGVNDIVCTSSTSVEWFVTAASYTGVHQTTPFPDTEQETSLSNSTFSSAITTSLNQSWLIQAGRSPAKTPTAGASTILRGGSSAIYSSWILDSNGGRSIGANSLNWSYSGASTSYWVLTAMAPAFVVTNAVTNIGLTSAMANGEVVDNLGATISERGFVISTNPNPTTSDTKATVAGTTGTMSTTISDLLSNTTYYVRAYAINTYGTGYGEEESFTTLNVTATDLIKDIGATDGEVYAVRIALTGTLGTVTVMLGTTGDTDVFEATGGTQVMQGTYEGTDGLILRMSADFNGTVDNVQYVRVEGTGTIDWASDIFTTVFPIESEVFFKRIEDDIFNTYRLYRYLDLLFKDLDGYVTVTIKSEANDAVTTKESTFVVGNTSTPASPFSKKKISFLCKDQAIIIGLSNASLNETFAIARFVLSGHKRPRKLFASDKIISIGN